MKKRSVLLKLFFSTLYLSAFTFGGGYVIVTLMKKQFVDKYLKTMQMSIADNGDVTLEIRRK